MEEVGGTQNLAIMWKCLINYNSNRSDDQVQIVQNLPGLNVGSLIEGMKIPWMKGQNYEIHVFRNSLKCKTHLYRVA